MRRLVTIWVSLLMVESSAMAADWKDFQAMFPAFPCSDGWMACLGDAGPLSPEPAKDTLGRPVPADFRVGWDLVPGAGFSPFANLSAYQGTSSTIAVLSVARVDELPPIPQPEAGVAHPKPPIHHDKLKEEVVALPISLERIGGPGEVGAGTLPKSDGDSCDDFIALERGALVGKMTDSQVGCLEKKATRASKQTEKGKASKLLMQNAYGKGDLKAWEILVRRHLEDIDQSDPDLCYKYAQHLAKRGAGSAPAAIKWADVALENKTVWSGNTYKERVSGLYKMRTTAAQAMWQAAEEDFARNPGNEDLKKKVETTRNTTKVFAREWYEYAVTADKDPTKALQVCSSAAGTETYCKSN